jgi:hypothetical protein
MPSIPALPSETELIRIAEAAFPNSGTIARLILLSGDLLTASATANAGTDEIIFGSAHGLSTGSRIKVTGSPTAPLALATTYYAIATSALAIKLASSLANAQSATAINLAASGTIGIEEQILIASDPIAVLLAKELPSSSFYNRPAISNTGAAVISGAEATKAPLVLTLPNATAGAIAYRHILVAFGASATIGDASGINGIQMITEASDQITAAGVTRQITLDFGAKAP